MAALPPPPSKIPPLIYAAREAEADNWDGIGFSPSMLGSECDRFLWLALRWAPAKEEFSGRMLRLFETGHIQEERLIADLRRSGIEVYEVDPDTGRQFSAKAISGHVRGKLDGIATSGVPEAPTKTHVVECKSHSEKSFNKVAAHRVKKGKFEHWVQMQVYCHIRGIDRALYVAVNKNTDEVYCERVAYDMDFCIKLFARLEAVLRAPTPPARLCTKRDDFQGKFCRAAPVCWGESFARLTCRSCVNSTPEFSGDAAWSCARHMKPLTVDEQREACPNHLFVPDLVPGEMLEVDEDRETITYRLAGGNHWTDGQDVAVAPIAVQGEAE
jgi:hypothetical protein